MSMYHAQGAARVPPYSLFTSRYYTAVPKYSKVASWQVVSSANCPSSRLLEPPRRRWRVPRLRVGRELRVVRS